MANSGKRSVETKRTAAMARPGDRPDVGKAHDAEADGPAAAGGRGRHAAPAAPPDVSGALTGVSPSGDNAVAGSVAPGQHVKVPIVEEHLSVEKRAHEVGRVVVHVEPRVERQELEVPLVEESVEVKRVPVNQIVEAATPVRQEGDVTIVPVFEEVLVVEKRLMLKEEIHLVRRRVATRERQTFELRKEQAHVLRSGESTAEPVPEGTRVAKTGSSVGGVTPVARGTEP